MLVQNEDDFGSGISLPDISPPASRSGLSPATEIRYGYVPLAPRDINLRLDALHNAIPPAHRIRQQHQQDVEAEQFGTSLYFG